MKPMHGSESEHAVAFQMENELLAHEIRFLRAKTASQKLATQKESAEHEASLRRAKSEHEAALRRAESEQEALLEKVRSEQEAAMEKAVADERRRTEAAQEGFQRSRAMENRERRRAESAEEQLRLTLKDLVWLLRRLDDSPLGPILRRQEGFRAARQRYLEKPT